MTQDKFVERPCKREMIGMPGFLKEFLTDESGQGLAEYLLVVALIALATIVGMQNMATQVVNAFNSLGNKLANYVGT